MVIKENESPFQHRHCERSEAISPQNLAVIASVTKQSAQTIQVEADCHATLAMTEGVGGRVPHLRFPDFRNAPPWEEKRLGDVLTVGNGRDYKHLSSGNIPVYGTGGFMLYVNDFLYEGESVCIGRKGTIDKPMFLSGKFWTVDTLFYTHSFKNCIPLFIFLIFQSISWQQLNEASGVPSLSKTTISNLKIRLPHPDEQRKIADFLTAVDAKISALQQKKTLLADYKKGLMQQLFPAKGESVPRLRFPDFCDAPPWEEKRLGDLCAITTGKLDANAMIPDGKYLFFTCAKEHYHIDEYAFDTDAILISGNGANVGYIHHYKGKFNAYQRTYVLDKFKDNIYFIQFLLEKNLHKQISIEKKDGNTPYIVMSTLSKMIVHLPHPDEQRKIADCLTAVDAKIVVVSDQIMQAQAFKKGLLQQLFV
jgi:type I restriction enzyme S subunit